MSTGHVARGYCITNSLKIKTNARCFSKALGSLLFCMEAKVLVVHPIHWLLGSVLRNFNVLRRCSSLTPGATHLGAEQC